MLSGAGVAGTAQCIAGRVRSAHQVRFRVIGSAAEQIGQEVDRIGDIDGSVIVVIAGIGASDGSAAGKEDSEVEDGIGQVSGVVRVAVAAQEGGHRWKQDDQIVDWHCTSTAEVGVIHFVGYSQRLDKIQPAAHTTTQGDSSGNRRVIGLQALDGEWEIDSFCPCWPERDVHGPAIGEQIDQHQIRSVSAIDR